MGGGDSKLQFLTHRTQNKPTTLNMKNRMSAVHERRPRQGHVDGALGPSQRRSDSAQATAVLVLATRKGLWLAVTPNQFQHSMCR